MKVSILEEFTRFGGGQTVFEHIYHSLNDTGYKVGVITDSSHQYLPDYIPSDSVVSTSLAGQNWSNPTLVLPSIIRLRKELRSIVPDGLTVNNHPNVFIYNATVNFAHEIFGFMAHQPGHMDKAALLLLRGTGLFRAYRGGYFIVQGNFTKRQTIATLASLGVSNIRIDTMDLPVDFPASVELETKDKSVLTFGRISPDKELKKVIQVARILQDTRFTIAGRMLSSDKHFYDYLTHIAPENVSFLPNPDSRTKEMLYRKSKVYFHTKKNENYGISVAEAISYGCYPVVPLEGGAYEDVLKNGEYGLGYANLEEASQQLTHAINIEKNELERIYNSRNRFSQVRFREAFTSKLKEFW